MARKLGVNKNIQINLWDFNIGLAGLSGIGKSTLMNEVFDKLLGSQGYLYFDIGKESGGKILKILNAPVETLLTWSDVEDAKDEVIDNRTTDYKEVKVVVFDTLDQLFELAEKEVIRRWNRNNIDKKASSINGVEGGFGKGLDKVIDLVLDLIFEFNSVNISFALVLHTKTKDLEDPLTGLSYQVITSNMTQRYFNAVKTKLDILGVAYIDREIVTEKLKTKDIKGNNKTRNVVSGEARKISFRSDDFNLDSKSRFPEIVSQIDMSSDQFIDAINDAISNVINKSGRSASDLHKKQESEEAEKMKLIAAKEKENKNKVLIKEVVSEIASFMKANIDDKDVINTIMSKTKELGFDNPMQIDNLKDANELKKLIK